MFVEKCPWGTGKYLLWQSGYYQDHLIERNRLVGEFNTREEAENEKNLQNRSSEI